MPTRRHIHSTTIYGEIFTIFYHPQPSHYDILVYHTVPAPRVVCGHEIWNKSKLQVGSWKQIQVANFVEWVAEKMRLRIPRVSSVEGNQYLPQSRVKKLRPRDCAGRNQIFDFGDGYYDSEDPWRTHQVGAGTGFFPEASGRMLTTSSGSGVSKDNNFFQSPDTAGSLRPSVCKGLLKYAEEQEV